MKTICRFCLIPALLLSLLAAVCIESQAKNDGTRGGAQTFPETAQVWLSTIDGKNQLSRRDDLRWSVDTAPAQYNINVNDSRKFQSMEGFGASFTDSSAFLLRTLITAETRSKVMADLFGKDGLHLNLIRQPMGSCDYNINLYTYDDAENDINLEKFSIDNDKKRIIPCIREAFLINPDIRVCASPWSAPGWMKTSGSIIGGTLKPEHYKTYAAYFRKFIEAYGREGVPIHAVTVQNEPLFTPGHYPGMSFPAEDECDFIKTALGPEFRRWKIETRIFVYDHNWDRPEYPLKILRDREANQYISGVAWHFYGGSHDAMSSVHDAFPDKEVWFTEGSGGEWIPEYHDAFMDQMKHVVRVPRNWSKTLVWWNMALDQDHGPSLLGDWSTCRGLVKIDTRTGEVTRNVDYYTMGHISRFVDRGACRIESDWFPDDLEDVAFLNPDGTRVLIVSNRKKKDKTFTVTYGGRHFIYTLPAEGAVTFKW
ncbi:MAG: glycoside hydrolase family 30 beta sandwich domain-containing protein [Vulcanimicrobiota bacterium]